MAITYKIELDWKSSDTVHEMTKSHELTLNPFGGWVDSYRMCMECPFVDLGDLVKEEWIRINVEVKIDKVYDVNDEIIGIDYKQYDELFLQ